MIIAQLDEQKYFTGSYSKVGFVPNGIKVQSLPEDLSNHKTTCWKYDEYEVEIEIQVPIQGESIQVPVIDDETGEQKVDENDELVFETQYAEITYQTRIVKETRVGWIFDEQKYYHLQQQSKLSEIRTQRETAFETIDKYQLALIYAELTNEQKEELKVYRQSWLDAPDTGYIPIAPEWLQI